MAKKNIATVENVTLPDAGARVLGHNTGGQLVGFPYGEFVQVSPTQSITGDKTFTGDIEFTGTANFTDIPEVNGDDVVVTTGNQSISGEKDFTGNLQKNGVEVVLEDRTITAGDGLDGGGNLSTNRTIDVDSTVVRTSRSISTGGGLSGGGNLSADRTFSVDGTVIRTTGNQTMSGTKTFSGTLTMTGNVNPRSNPTFGTQTIGNGNLFTPPRGWYQAASEQMVVRVNNNTNGQASSTCGPYNGANTTRVFNNSGSSGIWYWGRF